MPGRLAPRSVVFAALTLTLGLSLILGAEAILTDRRHRQVAEGVLVDYAGFAADELAGRLRAALGIRLSPVLNAIRAASTTAGRLPLPAALAGDVDSVVWREVADSITLFRIDPSDRRPVTTGSPLPRQAAEWLADSIPAQAARVFAASRAYLALAWVPADSAGRVAVIAPPRGDGTGLLGYVVPAGVLARVLGASLDRQSLLPSTLTRGAGADSAVTYRISSSDGREVVASSEPIGSRFAAATTLTPAWGGFRVEVGLRESLAGRLLIGGLPRSRLPMVIGLLTAATLLVAIAGVQLRRERELARAREAFVAGVSHELRTPLAQIRLFVETLRLGRVRSDHERQRSLEIIDREARRLGHLVDNLLAVSRAGRGGLRVSPRTLDLAPVLREAVETFTPLAAARGARIEVSAPDSVVATADPDAFQQIALNLLDNAVKYGPDGQTIRVALDGTAAGVRLSVEDEGRGVPVNQRERIFEPFVRLDGALDRVASGTGLGLALVRDLASLHRGTCRVEPGGGGGARFVVELAVTPSDHGGTAG